ncbi:hypothetical protein K7X08_034133 [Anisodus acutangulus]|uniref:Uncharacterized protein n=1 Tax=Anisodus acutangulus TaxID=402998 RepID=A0A9Q1M2M7_9SOLA|nr:hypothetical protein K7X08_034133 [Anisodus acutangulus]
MESTYSSDTNSPLLMTLPMGRLPVLVVMTGKNHSDPSKVSSTKPMNYKEKIEPCLAIAADSIADGVGKNLSFDASDSTSRQPSKGPKEAKASAIDFVKFQVD